MKRTITLILMAMMTITMTFAQRSKGESVVPGSTSPYGPDWELFNLKGKSYNYFKGNDAIDAITVENLLGFHWKGNEIDILGDQEIYLCNVATGEYLLVGDYWGETSMTNHVGMPYKLLPGTSTRRSGWGGPLADMQSDTYWIQPSDVREARVIGRASRNDGVSGHFEHNGYLFMRHQVEYEGDKSTEHPGGFLFKFEPVTTSTGEQAYIIYTHRKTEANASGSDTRDYEYFNRDSYLMVSSVGKAATADYTKVRFKKFAGQMCGSELVHTATLYDKTDLPTITSDVLAKSTNEHKYGTYDNANRGTTFTSNEKSGVEGVTVSITNNGKLGAGYYNLNSESTPSHTMEIYPPLSGDGNATLTISAPTGYVITDYYIHAISKAGGGRQFTVQTPKGIYSWINGLYSNGGTYRGRINESGYNSSSISMTISTIDGSDENTPLCFPEFSVTLKKIGDENLTLPSGSVNYTGTDAYKNSPLGDEVAFYNSGKAFVSLDEGLAAAKADNQNLWKIVTRAQRDRYRIVASDKKPVDVSSRISNPKFNTTYVYNVKKGDCKWDAGDNHWELKDFIEHPDYGWTWYNTDRPSHTDETHKQHVHPFDLTESDNGYWGIDKELHKVGTGQFYRFWDVAGGKSMGDGQEIFNTYGQEANYVGSIYKGTANLQQTITGLREGNYILFVRGFYAPHNMLEYTKDGETLMHSGSPMGTANDDWKKQAIVRMEGDKPVWLRSYDSYLFAWSHPHARLATQSDVTDKKATKVGELIYDGDEDKVEVRRMLPSIYEGATKVADIRTMSKEKFLDGDEIKYTQLGSTITGSARESTLNLMRDANVFAYYTDAFFGADGSYTYIVPKNLYGAGRFFNSTDANTHKAAQNYRIGLPVTVGADGELTIGVDHSNIKEAFDYTYNNGGGDQTITVQPSNDNEWVAFDDFELIYLGADEDEIFIVDELNRQGKVSGYPLINGYTGEPFKEGDKDKEGLWNSSLDTFYDYAMSHEGKSGEEVIENNTQAKDIFDSSDITNNDRDAKKIKNLLIRRTMTKDGWNSIVLPVPLTRAQVEEGFGADVAVSKLKTVQGTTLVYEAVNWTDKDAKNYLKAGQPYIIRPSINPTIDVGDKFVRPSFGIKVSTTKGGVAGLYLKGGDYCRNYQIEHEMDGPIYVIENVEIVMGEVFPNLDKDKTQVAVDQWTVLNPYIQDVKVSGYEQTFTLKETANYLNPDPDGDGPEKGVPAYSYYINKGKWRFTEKGFNTTKGLFTYLQLIDKTNDRPLNMPFLDRGLYFEPVEDPNGIVDVNDDIQPDDTIEVYDLMGRKVKRTGKGIYIMNGKKVLFR
ncbi:MAG: hypothetical protein IJV23_09215 [Prevotella sp.]|nr:hypothetical protein [Prevotella sp.]